MIRLRRKPVAHLPPDGDIPAAPQPALPLTQRERYHLMLRFHLTSEQVARLPLDIARTLLGGLR